MSFLLALRDKAAPSTDKLIQATYLAVSRKTGASSLPMYTSTHSRIVQLPLIQLAVETSRIPSPSFPRSDMARMESVRQGTAQESAENRPCRKKQGTKAAKRNKILIKRERSGAMPSMSSMVVQFDPALTLAKSRKFSFQSWFAGLTDLE